MLEDEVTDELNVLSKITFVTSPKDNYPTLLTIKSS